MKRQRSPRVHFPGKAGKNHPRSMGLDVESLPKSIMLRIFPIFLWICLKHILKNKKGACYIVHHICVWSPWRVGKPMPLDSPVFLGSEVPGTSFEVIAFLTPSPLWPRTHVTVTWNRQLGCCALMVMDWIFRIRTCFYWQDSWTKISSRFWLGGYQDHSRSKIIFLFQLLLKLNWNPNMQMGNSKNIQTNNFQ